MCACVCVCVLKFWAIDSNTIDILYGVQTVSMR